MLKTSHYSSPESPVQHGADLQQTFTSASAWVSIPLNKKLSESQRRV